MMNVKQYTYKENLILTIITLIIAIRPIIDLSGRYEGQGINLGGLVSAFLSILVMLFFCTKVKKLDFLKINIILVFIFLNLLSLLHLVFYNTTSNIILEYSRFLTGFAPLLLIILVSKQKELKIMLFWKVYLVSCLVPIIISWLQVIGVYPYSYFDVVNGSMVGRPSGGYFQPSSLTRNLIFLVLLSYILKLKGMVNKNFVNFIVFICFFTTVISTHRTSLIIIIIIILTMFILSLKKSFLSTKTILFGSIIFTIIGLSLLVPSIQKGISESELMDSINNIVAAKGSLDVHDDTFLRGRGMRWERTIEYMKQLDISRKIIGIGYQVYESHNDWLRMYMVVGWLGIILIHLLLVLLNIEVAVKVNSQGKFILILSTIVLIVFAITLQPTSYPNFMWMYFLVLLFIKTLFNKNVSNQS